MVHPYLRRRNGEEPVVYPDPTIRRLLGKTLGVPLFQEQAMQMAIHCAGFTPEQADQLRRAIAAWKSRQKVIYRFGRQLIEGMTARGYARDFAERCFEQIKGFSEYGFPESHAASFALIVYASAWMKRHHPAAFAAGLINSQPMGFYAPAQIVRDAKEHGVEVRPVDVNASGWDCSLEQDDERSIPVRSARFPASLHRCVAASLRLGMRLVRGLRRADADAIADAAAQHGPFDSIDALWRVSGVSIATMRKLAGADAFGSMGLDRQQALWHIRALRDEKLPLFERREEDPGVRKHGGTKIERTCDDTGGSSCPRALVPSCLPPVPASRQVVYDYASTGLSLKRHPVSFLRRKLSAMGAAACEALADAARCSHGRPISVAGLVLVRQRPGTAGGIIFMTLEDETGIANLIFRPDVFARFRRAARHGMCLLVRGRVERRDRVVHVMVGKVIDLTDELNGLAKTSRDFH
jgi:error-prone DNA polymerase